MKPIPSSLTKGLNLNTDRIITASKQKMPPSEKAHSVTPSLTLRQDVFSGSNNAFVELDGKRYYLNAARGSYINIIV